MRTRSYYLDQDSWLKNKHEHMTSAAGPDHEQISAFLDYLRYDRRRSLGTIETYENYLKRYVAWLVSAGVDYREPTIEHAQDFRSYLTRNPTKRKQEIAPSTVNAIMSAVASFYRWFQKGTSRYNPFTEKDLRFDSRSRGRSKKVRYLRGGQREAVTKWIGKRPPGHVKRTFRLMLATGLRVSEAASVCGSDVSKRDGVVWVEVRGKGNKHRSVPILDTQVAEEVLAEAKIHENEPLSKVKRRTLIWWAQVCKKETGVDFTTHRLRHTYGTDMIQHVDLDVLQEYFGHETLETTRIYARTIDKRKTEAARKVLQLK